MTNHRRSLEEMESDEPKKQLKSTKKLNKKPSILYEGHSLDEETSETAQHMKHSVVRGPQYYHMSVNNFLSPFRDCWSYLNVQGNNQAQHGLLRRLDQLTLTKKKWLIKNSIELERLSLATFVSATTIVIHGQEQVDWDKINALMNAVDSRTDEELNIEIQESEKSQDTNLIDDEQVGDGQWQLAGLAFAMMDDGPDESKRLDLLLESYKSAEHFSQLLTNTSLGVQHSLTVPPSQAMLVLLDGLLNIALLREDKRKNKRELLVQQYGFVSPIVFAKHSLEQIVDILYEQAVNKKDLDYRQLLYKFGYTTNTLPSKEQLLQTFYKHYIG